MAEFSTLVPDNRFNEFVMHTVERTGDNLHDVVTPDHPLMRMLEKTGAITRETPGRAVVEDIRYGIPNRITTLTQQSGFKMRNLNPDKNITRAYFPIHLLVQDFVIDYYNYIMCTSAVDMMQIVKQRLDALDTGLEVDIIDRIWNGHTEDGERQWGINDMVRFDPSTDPAAGKLGGIGVADIPTWANQAKNYNAPAISWNAGGALVQEMLSGPNGWLSLYIACSLNSAEAGVMSQPNLIPVNESMYLKLMQLQRLSLIVPDRLSNEQLGVDGFRFRNALVYHDPDIPDDPNDASWGVAKMLNTKVMKVCFIKGIEKNWSQMYKMGTETGYQKDRLTGVTTKIGNPRLQGVLYGAKPAAAA